jgi:hypothetical protein
MKVFEIYITQLFYYLKQLELTMSLDEKIVLKTLGKISDTHPLMELRNMDVAADKKFRELRAALGKGEYQDKNTYPPYYLSSEVKENDPCHKAILFVMDGILEMPIPAPPDGFLVERRFYCPEPSGKTTTQYSIMAVDTTKYPAVSRNVYQTLTWHSGFDATSIVPADFQSIAEAFMAYRSTFGTEEEVSGCNFNTLVMMGSLQWLCDNGSIIKAPKVEKEEGFFVVEFLIPEVGRVEYAANYKHIMEAHRQLEVRIGEIIERYGD